jgi:hypothetical protein
VGALCFDPRCSVVVVAEADEPGDGDGCLFGDELQGGGVVQDALLVVES